jgi:nucleoside-diphosphate-sugar epimerase
MSGVAFVAGATGYTGREAVRILGERGVKAIGHVRPDSSRLDEWRARFESVGARVDASAWTDEAIGAAFAKHHPTIVLALLGTTRARARSDRGPDGGTPSYETVDYGLTMMLVRAAEALEPKPRFVYLSAAGIGEREPRQGSYMHARWKVERDLRASSLEWVIARPSIITGSDRDEVRPGERIAAVVADGALAVAGVLGGRRLRDRWRSTTPAVLAGALVRLGMDPDAAGRVVESEGLR